MHQPDNPVAGMFGVSAAEQPVIHLYAVFIQI